MSINTTTWQSNQSKPTPCGNFGQFNPYKAQEPNIVCQTQGTLATMLQMLI